MSWNGAPSPVTQPTSTLEDQKRTSERFFIDYLLAVRLALCNFILLVCLPALDQIIRYAVTGPGDLLIFPPLWGHTVITQAGPNAMVNIRRKTILQPFLSQPIRTLETILSTLLLEPHIHNLHKPAGLNKLSMELWRQRERHHSQPGWVPPESGCKDKLKALFK